MRSEPRNPDKDPLVETRDLVKVFPVRGGVFGRERKGLRAVDGVSIGISSREIYGLVGESGCGKTTFGKMLLKLIEPTSGIIRFDGTDINALGGRKMRTFRRRIQIIFQDPFGSLNPRKSVGSILAEPLRIRGAGSSETRTAVREMISTVGLSSDSDRKYPHEFSGGQRQRIGIARALILNPEFLVADEPVSALDVSIQAQILNLLMELKTRFSLTILFISHDLRVVRSLCDRVGVMYLGRLVEEGRVEDLFAHPVHPYTEELIQAVPEPDPGRGRGGRGVRGEVPGLVETPSGCPFHPRCPLAKEICRRVLPELTGRGPVHRAACHLR